VRCQGRDFLSKIRGFASGLADRSAFLVLRVSAFLLLRWNTVRSQKKRKILHPQKQYIHPQMKKKLATTQMFENAKFHAFFWGAFDFTCIAFCLWSGKERNSWLIFSSRPAISSIQKAESSSRGRKKLFLPFFFLQHYEQSNHTLYWFSRPDEISEWGKGLLEAFSMQTNVKYVEFLDKKNGTVFFEDAIVFSAGTSLHYVPDYDTNDWLRQHILQYCSIPIVGNIFLCSCLI